MAKNPHIRPEHVEAVANAIRAWGRGTISWEDVRKLAKPIIGYLPSRTGLAGHAAIQAAFSAKSKKLSEAPAGKTASPGSKAEAQRMIEARDTEIAELKNTVDLLRQKFDRWSYNAMLHNITLDKLDQPLPEISRKKFRA